MKNTFRIILVTLLSLAIVSCQKKEDPVTPTPPAPEPEVDTVVVKTLAYMDTVGYEALSQIDPDDFKKLANLVNDLPKDSLDIEIDEVSEAKLVVLLLKMVKTKGIVIDLDDVTGTLTLNGKTLKYETGTGKTLIYVAGSNTYTAKCTTTSGSKEVYLGDYELDLGKGKSKVKIYLKVPSKATADVYFNKEASAYMGGDFTINSSSMPTDWSKLTLDKVNGSVSGTGYINGKNSYKADITKFSVASCKGNFDGTLYGNKGNFLLSGTASAGFKVEEDGWSFDIDTTTVKFEGKLIDKLETKYNTSNKMDIYLGGSKTPGLSVGAVNTTFSSGTVKKNEEVFTETNFPKTWKSAKDKIEKFSKMFDLD